MITSVNKLLLCVLYIVNVKKSHRFTATAFVCIYKNRSTFLPKPTALAAGFGSPSSKNNKSKIRKVTGHTGSGTKALRDAANTFDKLYKDHGKDGVNDLYVRAVGDDTFWFVGKVAVNLAAENSLTPEQAVIAQKRLILEYAKTLRPQNFSNAVGSSDKKVLEIWTAPGNSEMECVQNKITLEKVRGSIDDLPEGFLVKGNIGYNPEIYVGDEVQSGGLRIVRDDEGKPVKPVFEVNQ